MLKKVNIEDIEVSGYDCYSASLAVIGNYLNAEYQLMSIGIWCFEYKYGFSNKLIGNAVKPYIRRNNVNIENLCGVKINSYKLRESFSFDEIVEYINQGIPIIIKGDLYDCPWTVAYLKCHMEHYYIIVGYSEKKEVICNDPYFGKKNLRYPFDVLMEKISKYYIVRNVKKRITLSKLKKEFTLDARHYFLSQTPQKISAYAYDLENNMDISAELYGYNSDYIAVPLLDNIRVVCNNRLAYGKMLKYCNMKYSLFNKEIIDTAQVCYKKWKIIERLLMKCCIVQDKMGLIDRIVNNINSVNKEEKKMWSLIANSINER